MKFVFFSERKKLEDEYYKWLADNKDIKDCPLNVIGFLYSEKGWCDANDAYQEVFTELVGMLKHEGKLCITKEQFENLATNFGVDIQKAKQEFENRKFLNNYEKLVSDIVEKDDNCNGLVDYLKEEFPDE